MFNHSTFTNGGAVFHGVTLPEYPGRRFSLWVLEGGALTDAVGSQHSPGLGTLSRNVKPDSPQWRACKAKGASLYRIYCT